MRKKLVRTTVTTPGLTSAVLTLIELVRLLL